LTHVAEGEEKLTKVFAEDPGLETDGAQKKWYSTKIEKVSKS